MIEVVDRVPTYPNRIKITKQDGSSELVTWERADEPVVDGTPINKALFDSIAADIGAGLSADKAIYVSTLGSDALGDGTSTNPYATIQKAVNTLPKNLNGFTAAIYIASGTYNEDVVVEKIFGGKVILTGNTNDAVNIRSMMVENVSLVMIEKILINVLMGIGVVNSLLLCSSALTVDGSSGAGVIVTYNGCFCAFDSLTIFNSTLTAIDVAANSRLFANRILGNATSGSAIRSVNGSVVSYNSLDFTAETMFVTTTGGRIYSVAQTNIPNY